jgi:hypothetical protein
MSQQHHPSVDERLARNEAFWTRAPADQPLLGMAVNITFPLVRFSERPLPLEEGQVTPDMIDPRQFLADWDSSFQRTEARGETLFMVASPFDGIPWIEAIAGCDVYCSMAGGSVWAQHPDPTWESLRRVQFDPDSPWLRKLLEYSETLREHSAGRYPVGVPVVRGVADMLEGLLGSQRMVLEFYDHAEDMHRLLEACCDIWKQLSDLLIQSFGEFRGGMGVGRRRVWGRGSCMLYQDDAVSLLSPAIYREFILPRQDEIFRRWDRTMIHVHSGTLPIVMEDLLSLESLDAIEVLIDPTGRTLLQLIPLFRRIQEEKALLVCGDMHIDAVRLLLDNLSPSGLALLIKVKAEDDADVAFSRIVSYLDGR